MIVTAILTSAIAIATHVFAGESNVLSAKR